jgi:hypothetical protein
MIPAGPVNNINLLLISMSSSRVLFLYIDGQYNIWMSEVQLVFILKCKLVKNEVEDFLQNRNLQDVNRNQLRKITCKCSNVKRFHLGLLCIPETKELTYAA